VGGEGEGRGKRGEMTQTLYAHINKRKKKEEDNRKKNLKKKHLPGIPLMTSNINMRRSRR
jgi:hypothetical protein